ncbi:tetratricopeptide repeat protein, partial [Bifidobacterium sp. CP2]|uniref:tetratricopeptide repeat protein n=1 Tax=Bifidobacterium sp. CP2 TaxID=2809025 RepID=UPI001BDC99B2|nr:tetratricopeptide repeat protein [Bifidobacterium sp. CP2]
MEASLDSILDWDAALSAGNRAAYDVLRSAYDADTRAKRPLPVVGEAFPNPMPTYRQALREVAGSVSEPDRRHGIEQIIDNGNLSEAATQLIDTLGEPLVNRLLAQRIITDSKNIAVSTSLLLTAITLLSPDGVVTTMLNRRIELAYKRAGESPVTIAPDDPDANGSPIVAHAFGVALGIAQANQQQFIITDQQCAHVYDDATLSPFATALHELMSERPLLLLGYEGLPYDENSMRADPTHVLDLVKQFGSARHDHVAIIPAPSDPRQRDAQIKFLGSLGIMPILTNPSQTDALRVVLDRLLRDTDPIASLRLDATTHARNAKRADRRSRKHSDDKNAADMALQEWHKAIDAYQQLADHMDYARYMPMIADTHTLCAAVHVRRNQPERAEQEYQEALSIWRQLAQSNPSTYYQTGLAMTLSNLAILHSSQRQYEQAEQEYQEALSIWRQLAQSNPSTYYQPDPAMTLSNLANLHSSQRQYEQAEQEYQEALSIWRQLAQSNPSTYYQPDLAMTLSNLANLHSDQHRYEQAEQEYQEALSILRQLAETNPDAYRLDVATTLNGLATLYRDLRQYEKAEQKHQEALSILRQLAETNPDAYQFDVAATLNGLADMHRYLHQYKQA